MKKFFAIALFVGVSAALALSLALESGAGAAASGQSGSPGRIGTQIANPFVDCETLDEAARLAEFEFIVPDTLEQYGARSITAIEKLLIQVTFRDADGRQLTLRKGNGQQDISGDYNDYPEVRTVTVGDNTVTLKGRDGRVTLAVWSTGDAAYSIHFSGADGLSEAEMTALVQALR